MKRHLLFLLALACLPLLCGAGAPVDVCTGLSPVAHIVSAVGGSRVKVSSMLPPGRSPHDYAPGTRELRLAMNTTDRIRRTTLSVNAPNATAEPCRKQVNRSQSTHAFTAAVSLASMKVLLDCMAEAMISIFSSLEWAISS